MQRNLSNKRGTRRANSNKRAQEDLFSACTKVQSYGKVAQAPLQNKSGIFKVGLLATGYKVALQNPYGDGIRAVTTEQKQRNLSAHNYRETNLKYQAAASSTDSTSASSQELVKQVVQEAPNDMVVALDESRRPAAP